MEFKVSTDTLKGFNLSVRTRRSEDVKYERRELRKTTPTSPDDRGLRVARRFKRSKGNLENKTQDGLP